MRYAHALSTSLLLVVATIAVHGADAPAKLSRAEADVATKAILKDRSDTEAWLRADPTSYLAAVGRTNFEGKTTLTVGRAKDNDVRLDAPEVAAHHLRVTVHGPKFHVQAVDPIARFTIDKKEQRDAVLDPSRIGVGRFVLRLSHQNFPAIIVFDPSSPRFKEYKGIKYFPVDLEYRYVATLIANSKHERVTIMSTQGTPRKAVRAGWFDLQVNGKAVRLEADRLLEPGVGENDLSIFFRDATSGKESYGFGRYVDPVTRKDGTFLIDFNMAYNPACAFSDYYNCPVPPKQNTLSVAIRAGEMDSHYH
jgi:uncharacterized protein (DUF1684 family)